jgi:membrane associated rhomboid family serine protease
VLTLVPLIVYYNVIEVPAILLLGVWFAIQLFSAGAIAVTSSTEAGGVAFVAHVAGFAAGAVGVLAFKRRTLDPWNNREA